MEMGDLILTAAVRSSSMTAADEGLGAGVTDAVEEQVEEASEGVERGRNPVLLVLIGVGVSGRRRLVTSLSGGAAFRWRLMALQSGAVSGEAGGVGCLIGTAAA